MGLLLAEASLDEKGTIGVRGCVENPLADVPLNPDGSLAVGSVVGSEGLLRITRRHPSWKENYTGVVELATGEIGDDLAHYLAQSEQTPSAVGLGIFVGSDGRVSGAAGFLAAVLPGCDEEELSALEENVASMPPPSALPSSTSAIRRLTRGAVGEQLRQSEPVVLRCSCAGGGLAAYTASTILKEEGTQPPSEGPLEVRCDWCGRQHRVEV